MFPHQRVNDRTRLRRLSNRQVMKQSVVAALGVGLFCLPRIVFWEDRPDFWLLMWGILVWCLFFLWLFVFAWHELYGENRIFQWKVAPKILLPVVAISLVWSLILATCCDPVLRELNPKEYPDSELDTVVRTFFTVSLESLFLLFAPFAILLRLSKSVKAAYCLTLVLALLTAGMKMNSLANQLPLPWMGALFGIRLVGSGLLLWLYVKKGAPIVWLASLIIGLRHLWHM